jgi:glycosyltransferase 2 family protein
MTSDKWKNVVTPIFGITLFIIVLSIADTGAILASLRSARPELILLGLFVVQFQIILSAVRWCYTAARLGHPLRPAKAIAEYYLGSLVNMVLPGGIAGDAMRASRSRAADRRWSIPVLAIFLERFAGQIALCFIGGLGLIIWPFVTKGIDSSAILLLALVILGLAAATTAMALLVWFSGSPWWRRFIRKIGQSISISYGLPHAWLIQGVLSLAIVMSYIAAFAIASAAIGAPLPIIGLITAVPVCLLTMAIPVSIGGWGTREAAAAALWPLLGLSAGQGVAASVLYGAIITIGALPGLGLLISPAFRKR